MIYLKLDVSWHYIVSPLSNKYSTE